MSRAISTMRRRCKALGESSLLGMGFCGWPFGARGALTFAAARKLLRAFVAARRFGTRQNHLWAMRWVSVLRENPSARAASSTVISPASYCARVLSSRVASGSGFGVKGGCGGMGGSLGFRVLGNKKGPGISGALGWFDDVGVRSYGVCRAIKRGGCSPIQCKHDPEIQSRACLCDPSLDPLHEIVVRRQHDRPWSLLMLSFSIKAYLRIAC